MHVTHQADKACCTNRHVPIACVPSSVPSSLWPEARFSGATATKETPSNSSRTIGEPTIINSSTATGTSTTTTHSSSGSSSSSTRPGSRSGSGSGLDPHKWSPGDGGDDQFALNFGGEYHLLAVLSSNNSGIMPATSMLSAHPMHRVQHAPR